MLSLVAVLSIGSYFLFPDVLPKMVYAIGATIQDDASATEDFINGILESGGICFRYTFIPSIHLMFENGTEYKCYIRVSPDCERDSGPGPLYQMSWLIKCPDREWELLDYKFTPNGQVKINASGLQKVSVGWTDGQSVVHYGGSHNSSKPGHILPAGVNLSWYGNYNIGREINTTLHVDSTTTDLGTHSDNYYVHGFKLDLTQDLTAVNFNNVSKFVYWDTGPYWATSDRSIVLPNGTTIGLPPYGCWLIQAAQLSQMVGQFESASIGFEGTVWLDGNYTVTENGVVRNVTMNVAKNVYFGTVDVTSENGTISTLSFDFNRIEIILFAYPKE